MNAKIITQLYKRIDGIKKNLSELGDMRPGSISKQFNVCGNPNCRCKDPKNPKKHGPYFQLSYTRKGKSTTEFVRKESLNEVRTQLKNYETFKILTEEWIDSALKIARRSKQNHKR